MSEALTELGYLDFTKSEREREKRGERGGGGVGGGIEEKRTR